MFSVCMITKIIMFLLLSFLFVFVFILNKRWRHCCHVGEFANYFLLSMFSAANFQIIEDVEDAFRKANEVTFGDSIIKTLEFIDWSDFMPSNRINRRHAHSNADRH